MKNKGPEYRPARELVVARFNEDISWTSCWEEKLTIYNKGGEIKNKACIQLEDFGREAHTYLYHIVTHWENLAETTIFTQANPFDHTDRFLQLLRYRFDKLQPLTYCWRKSRFPSLRAINLSKPYWVGNHKIFVAYQNHNAECLYPVPNWRDNFCRVRQVAKIPENVPIYQFFWKNIFNEPIEAMPDLLPVSFAAIFSVPKSIILSRPKAFYENLLELVSKTEIINNPVPMVEFLLERLWLVIFRYHETHPNLYIN